MAAETKPGRVALGKTTRPSLSGILPRARVFALLDAARRAPVVWVSGPPGCGKTTAVASWLDHAGGAALWYQLDDGDADAATFFYYLGAAAAAAAPEAEPLPLLTPEYQSALAVFTRRYFQALFARLGPPFAIVFDGYHELPASAPLHEVMREALRELPPGGTVVLISRGDPPPALARYRANRTLEVIGWDELRLTREETASIAAQRRPDLAPAELDELYARTEGWAAGLVLLLEQARAGGSFAAPPDGSTRQLVFDYLAGEIFQKSDARTQDFLLGTAYAGEMSAALAQALSGDADAGRMLDELHRNNYFVALRRVPAGPVYQYHPLFRDFLLSRIEETLPKERRRKMQKAAAALLEEAGRIEEAVGLFGRSHDWDAMARLIDRHAEALLDQGRGETVTRWVEELPPEIQQRHPWMFYWAAASRAQLAPRESRLLYERAFELFRAAPGPDLRGMALAASGAMDAILYELDDFSLLDRWIAVLDEAERAGVRYPSPGVAARVACSMVFSLTLRQPQRRDIEQWLGRALEASRDVPDPNLRMFVGLLCAFTLMWSGVFARAGDLIESMRRLAREPGVSPFSLITLRNVEAMFAMLTARNAECQQAAREGLEIARATGVHTWTFQMQLHAYGGALGAGDLAGAARLARELQGHAGGAGRLDLCMYHLFQGWEAVLRRDPMGALQQGRTALRMAIEVGCPYFEALCRLALAQVLVECGDERKCVAHLQQLREIVRQIDNRHLEFTCLLGFADIALEHGRPRPGLKSLRLGLEIGRQYGYRHFLGWRPETVARLCVRALEAGVEPEYARDLVRRRALAPLEPPLAVEDWPWRFRVHTLGPFRLLRDDAPLGATGKAQRRPMELLKVLVALGGEQVSEDRITGAMWPRIDGDSAHRSFTSTLHRLRKLLGEDRALVLHEGRLSLEPRHVWVDTWALDRALAEIEALAREPVPAGRLEALERRMLELYRGPFLATDADEAWGVPARERWRSRFVRGMTELGRAWGEAGQPERALACYEKCLEADPLAEGFYRHLMLGYQRLERRAEAIEAYQRCRKALAALNVEPSPETRALYEKLA